MTTYPVSWPATIAKKIATKWFDEDLLVLREDIRSALLAIETSVAAISNDIKSSVRAATVTGSPLVGTFAANVLTESPIGGALTVDGVLLVAGDRVLLQHQQELGTPAGQTNGIYVMTQQGTGVIPWILTRSTDANTSAEVTAGMLVPVEEGTANKDEAFELTTNNPITLNTTVLVFAPFAGPNYLTADEKAGVAANTPTAADPLQTLATQTAAIGVGTAASPAKKSVRVATTGALAGYVASGTGVGKTFTAGAVGILTIDAVAMVLGDDILVKDEGNADGGIYTVTTEGTGAVAAILTRRTDADTDAEVPRNNFVQVREGAIHVNQWFQMTNTAVLVVDTGTPVYAACAGPYYPTANEKDGLAANVPTGANPVQTLTEMTIESAARLASEVKTNVRVIETSPITIATPGANIDGVVMVLGDRVLLTGQAAPDENGIWVWNTAAVPLTRPTDFIAGVSQAVGGCRVFSEEGTLANRLWYLTEVNPVDVDTDSLSWLEYLTPYYSTNVTVLTAADLAALNATPISLAPAPGAGFYLEPISFTILATYGTAAFNDVAGNGNLLFQHIVSNRRIAESEADGVVDLAATTQLRTVRPERADIATPTIQDVTPQNEGIEVINNGTAFVDPGTSTTTVQITTQYRILALT